MSGDQQQPRTLIPAVFVHGAQMAELLRMSADHRGHLVRVGVRSLSPAVIMTSVFRGERKYARRTMCMLNRRRPARME